MEEEEEEEEGKEKEETLDNGRRTLSDALSQLVRSLAKAISEARDVCDVTNALQVLRSLLCTHDIEKSENGAVSLEIAEQATMCREKALQISSGGDWKRTLRSVFYQGLAFPFWTKVLLFSVAPDWLACFPSAVQVHLFDAFFTEAPPIILIKELVSSLAPKYDEAKSSLSVETTLSCRTVERLLTRFLFEDDGIKVVVMEFSRSRSETLLSHTDHSITVLAQYVASIPDKARREAPRPLLSPHFHMSATLSALQASEKHWLMYLENSNSGIGPLVFTAELCARFCRRGHADIVASQMLHKILNDIKHSDFDTSRATLDHNQALGYWTAIMNCVRDTYALERLVSELLRKMSEKQTNDSDAYFILCLLFSELVKSQNNVRLLFAKKILFWTNISFRCTRWVMFFIVFNRAPIEVASKDCVRFELDAMQVEQIKCLVDIWAEERFIQVAEMQKQSHITAAICLALSIMTKTGLESSQDLLKLLLQGVGRRLESPLHLVRLMAKKVALAFSLLVDPTNPLLLDEDDKVEDLADWDLFDKNESSIIAGENHIDNDFEGKSTSTKASDMVNEPKKVKKVKDMPYDPDEAIDLQTYRFSDDDDSDESDSESDSSLQPYDLSDDESDLLKDKFPAQLSDCAANLRKGDDPDAVEKALEVVEKLVRAVPEELENAAPDLVHALIHVRCSDIAVEGQEQSAERRRYDALVALLACVPLTVEVFTQTLYSPHVDISQRLLILEVMSDAARELAASDSRLEASSSSKGLSVQRITEIDKTWYGPGGWTSIGAGPWKEVYEPTSMVSLVHKYERELPQRHKSSEALGKSRRWGHRSMQLREQRSQRRRNTKVNEFVAIAPSFMLPVMRDYDKKQHGVDLLGRDFIVLGKLICMLGVCMECISLQPEACVLAACLLSMLRTRHISGHPEVYVRRATLYAISRVMVSLHPSHVKNTFGGGDAELASGLEWIRSWAMEVLENDTDQDCLSMAMACLHVHSELFLQATRVAEAQRMLEGNTLSFKLEDSHKISLLRN